MPTPADLRVLVVVESRLWRELLVDHLAAQEGFVVGSVADPDEALAFLRQRPVDVALLDMTIPASTAAVASLAAAAPDLMLVGLGFRATENRIVTALESGMAGSVTIDDGLGALSEALTTVMAGGVVCSPLVAASLVEHVRVLTGAPAELARNGVLTHREHEILALIEDGLTNKEIARRLDIEIATVKNHVHRILVKLGVPRREQAAALARSQGGVRRGFTPRRV